MHDIAIRLGIPGCVVHVPAEFFEERIKEVAAKLGLVVAAGLVGVNVLPEAGDEVEDSGWRGHSLLYFTDEGEVKPSG
jgi:hypothetical protein